MLYNISSFEGTFLGTFETDRNINSLRSKLEQIFECNGIDISPVRPTGFSNIFYVHRNVKGDFRNVEFLGTFETNKKILEVWDLLFEIFSKDGDGIFVREERLV